MFATLVGTDFGSTVHLDLFRELRETAERKGFVPGDNELRITPDQVSLDDWSLEFRGPASPDVDFLLAVTATAVPGISPIPIMKTLDGPLFAVVVMGEVFGYWQPGRDFREVREAFIVKAAFLDFLDSVATVDNER